MMKQLMEIKLGRWRTRLIWYCQKMRMRGMEVAQGQLLNSQLYRQCLCHHMEGQGGVET